MTAQLDQAYAVLEHARECLPAATSPDVMARLDRQAAAARDALALYGIDLTVPEHLDAATAVVDLLAMYATAGPTHVMWALGQVQQALIQNVHHRATPPAVQE
jgi:hypothetical protein